MFTQSTQFAVELNSTLINRDQSGYSREREQQQSLWAQQEAEIAALKEQLKSTQLRASEMVHEVRVAPSTKNRVVSFCF